MSGGGPADHLQPPLQRVAALGAEEVDVLLELQLEHVLLVDVVGGGRLGDHVTQQRQRGQWALVLPGEGGGRSVTAFSRGRVGSGHSSCRGRGGGEVSYCLQWRKGRQRALVLPEEGGGQLLPSIEGWTAAEEGAGLRGQRRG